MPDKGRVVLELSGKGLGIFRMGGALYAYENICPHQGGPVCQGKLMPRILEVLDEDQSSQGTRLDEGDMHVVCPWHGFEYSIKGGCHAGYSRITLKKLRVEESEGRIRVTF